MKAELVPDNGEPPIPILKDVTVIGRKEYCDVVIDHPSLSKRHCVLVKTDGLLVIRDLATTNGTKVKGQKVRWAALLPEDRLTLGGYKVKVYLGPDGVAAPSERRIRAEKSSAVAVPAVASRDEAMRPVAPGFAAPSPLGTPMVAAPGVVDEDLSDSNWRNLMYKKDPAVPGSNIPMFDDVELIELGESDEKIIELD